MKKVAIIGRPNSGKTTIFNALTNSNSSVGNWSGTTTIKKEEYTNNFNNKIKIIDLPGCHSIISLEEMCVDEKITSNFIINNNLDYIINVINVFYLKEELYLTIQLFEQLNLPIIIITNYINLNKNLLNLKLNNLSRIFSCPIIPFINNEKKNILILKKRLFKNLIENNNFKIKHSKNINFICMKNVYKMFNLFKNNNAKSIFIRTLEGDFLLRKYLKCININVKNIRKNIEKHNKESLDIKIAKKRQINIKYIINKINPIFNENKIDNSIIDKITINKILGIPFFLIVMYFMFTLSISFGGVFQEFFDLISKAMFIESIDKILNFFNLSNLFVKYTFNGIGIGMNIILNFIPSLMFMFIFLSFLELSGYMSRAAFIVDKLMKTVGLPGKSLIPIIVGFGCNVPAILSARTLESQKERILTIMMTPFISCNARFAIYIAFITIFLPNNGQNIIFLLYLIGIFISIITCLILKESLYKKNTSKLIIELPKYVVPKLNLIFKNSFYKLKKFISKAIKIIVPLSIILSLMNNLESGKYSTTIIENLGKKVVIIFNPIGIEEENWAAAISLIAGILSKEIIIGSLNNLYLQNYKNNNEKNISIKETIYIAFYSIYKNIVNIFTSIFNIKKSNTYEISNTSKNINNISSNFQNRNSVISYLLFILLYSPCVSVIIAISKELDKKWATFSLLWSIYIAYFVSILYYQITNFINHKIYSFLWISFLLFTFYILTIKIKKYLKEICLKN